MFLVTGTGRSGTGFMARALASAGIPCGHERVYNPRNIRTGRLELDQGESSWLAAPFRPDVPTAHVVRNPLEVVRSMVGISWLGGTNPYEKYAKSVMGVSWPPTRNRRELIARASRFVLHWHSLLDGIEWWSLEDIDLPAVAHHLTGQVIEPPSVSSDVNHRRRDEAVTWGDIPELAPLAERFGYEIS